MDGGDGSLTGDVAGRALGAYGRRFPRAARLLRSREFREAYDGGEGAHGRWMVLFRREGKGMDFRLGVVASKRVGGAPERARAKRRLREAFRRNRWRVERGQADVVAVARKGAVTAKWDDLEAEWLALLRKLGFRFCGEGEGHTETRRDGDTEGDKLTRRRGDAEGGESKKEEVRSKKDGGGVPPTPHCQTTKLPNHQTTKLVGNHTEAQRHGEGGKAKAKGGEEG